MNCDVLRKPSQNHGNKLSLNRCIAEMKLKFKQKMRRHISYTGNIVYCSIENVVIHFKYDICQNYDRHTSYKLSNAQVSLENNSQFSQKGYSRIPFLVLHIVKNDRASSRRLQKKTLTEASQPTQHLFNQTPRRAQKEKKKKHITGQENNTTTAVDTCPFI